MCGRRGRKVVMSMRESHKSVSFSTCQKMCSCRFATQAWHFVSFDVCEEECVCAAAWQKSCRFYEGKVTTPCLSRRVRRCAHVVLQGRRATL